MANVKLVSPQAYDAIVTATINVLAANSRTVGNIVLQAGMPPQTQVLVPGNEIWHIEDIFNSGAAPIGEVLIEVMVNNTPQPHTPGMLGINVVQPTRLKLPRSVMCPPAGAVNINFVNPIAWTSTMDVAVHLKIMRYPTSPGTEG